MERMGRTILALMAAWALAGHPAGAQAQNEYRFIVGLDTLDAYVTQGWHPNIGWALDLVNNAGATTGLGVSYWSRHVEGSTGMAAWAHIHSGVCKGVRVELYDINTGVLVAHFYYIHIDPAGSFPRGWGVPANFDWTGQSLGWVAGQDNPGCPWTNPHLHQEGANGNVGSLENNGWFATGSRIYPTDDWVSNWVHRKVW